MALNLEEGRLKEEGRLFVHVLAKEQTFWLVGGVKTRPQRCFNRVKHWAKCENYLLEPRAWFDSRHRLLPPLPLFYCCTLLW